MGIIKDLKRQGWLYRGQDFGCKIFVKGRDRILIDKRTKQIIAQYQMLT